MFLFLGLELPMHTAFTFLPSTNATWATLVSGILGSPKGWSTWCLELSLTCSLWTGRGV